MKFFIKTAFSFIFCLVVNQTFAGDEADSTPSMAKLAIYKDEPQVFQQADRLANISAHTEDEMLNLLTKASKLLDDGETFPQKPGVIFLLHGDEVKYFTKQNYQQYRSLVEKAAQLDALNVIDVQVCEIYLRAHGISKDQLPAFVETVENGPEAETTMLKNGFVHF